MYLLDTSFLVAFLRRNAPPRVLTRTTELVTEGLAAISGMVRMEILVGCRAPDDYDRVSARLGALSALEMDDETWHLGGRLGFDLRRAGVTIGVADLSIAATAIRHDAVLVHMDSDFERIARHSNLRTESYL